MIFYKTFVNYVEKRGRLRPGKTGLQKNIKLV